MSRGATDGIYLVLNIAANLIVFIAFLAFFNNLVEWLGDSVGVFGLTFQVFLTMPIYFFFECVHVPTFRSVMVFFERLP